MFHSSGNWHINGLTPGITITGLAQCLCLFQIHKVMMDVPHMLSHRQIGSRDNIAYKLIEERLIQLLDHEWYFDNDALTDLFAILMELANNSHCAKIMLLAIDNYQNHYECDIKSIVFLVERLMHIVPFPDHDRVIEIIDDIKMNSI